MKILKENWEATIYKSKVPWSNSKLFSRKQASYSVCIVNGEYSNKFWDVLQMVNFSEILYNSNLLLKMQNLEVFEWLKSAEIRGSR